MSNHAHMHTKSTSIHTESLDPNAPEMKIPQQLYPMLHMGITYHNAQNPVLIKCHSWPKTSFRN